MIYIATKYIQKNVCCVNCVSHHFTVMFGRFGALQNPLEKFFLVSKTTMIFLNYFGELFSADD